MNPPLTRSRVLDEYQLIVRLPQSVGFGWFLRGEDVTGIVIDLIAEGALESRAGRFGGVLESRAGRFWGPHLLVGKENT